MANVYKKKKVNRAGRTTDSNPIFEGLRKRIKKKITT